MYIVVIAWLYVVVLMAVLESSWIGGLMTLLIYGIVPLAILMYVTGTSRRRRRQKNLTFADEPVRQTDSGDAERNQ